MNGTKKAQPIQAAARAQAAGKVRPPTAKRQAPPPPLVEVRVRRRRKTRPCKPCRGVGNVSPWWTSKITRCEACGGSGERGRG